jgi:hypothetical protein
VLKGEFPIYKVFIENNFAFVNKTLVEYAQPTLVECLSTTCTSKKAHDVSKMVVNFLFNNSESKHIIIGLFQAKDINGVVMFVKLKQVLDKFLLT